MFPHASEQARFDRFCTALGYRFANCGQLHRRQFAVVGFIGRQHFFRQLAQRIVNHLCFPCETEIFGQFSPRLNG